MAESTISLTTASTPWGRALDIGRAQRGVLAARQATNVGVAASSFYDRIRREGWERPFRGVVLLPGAVADPTTLIRAAALAVGQHAVVTGASALFLRGSLQRAPAKIHLVAAGPTPRVAPSSAVRLVRSRTLRDEHQVLDAGIWVATPARAFLDAASWTGRARLRSWLIDARQRRIVTVAEVVALARSFPSVPGRGRLLTACREVDASGADSALVAEVERRLRAEGFTLDVPPRTVAVPGRSLHPDLTIEGAPVAIEVDGFGTHSDRHALDLDQRKHNAYALAGWVVLRIGWTRMEHDWDGFVAELRAAMASFA